MGRKSGRSVEAGEGNSEILGVELIPLQTFKDDRGEVMHMLRTSDPHFIRFGEIYFSTIKQGVTKAWKNHRSVTANYACVSGKARFAMVDGRETSPTFGKTIEVDIGPENHLLIVVPPGVWNGFHGLASPKSIVASCSTDVYDPNEFERIPPDSERISYTWPQGPTKP